ncbi:MAG: hypothetical protein L6244_04840, partial [Candidatus Methanoperedenaceae archaeon]|nr:hypothetical protein [Candidatus Methanoperedenaceae archaeon]
FWFEKKNHREHRERRTQRTSSTLCSGMKNSIFMFIYEPQFIADSVDSVVDYPYLDSFFWKKL